MMFEWLFINLVNIIINTIRFSLRYWWHFLKNTHNLIPETTCIQPMYQCTVWTSTKGLRMLQIKWLSDRQTASGTLSPNTLPMLELTNFNVLKLTITITLRSDWAGMQKLEKWTLNFFFFSFSAHFHHFLCVQPIAFVATTWMSSRRDFPTVCTVVPICTIHRVSALFMMGGFFISPSNVATFAFWRVLTESRHTN